VSLQTRDEAGREVAAVSCELTNNKGRWFITTPGSATIVRSNDDMQVLCNKAGHEPGRAAVVSATKGMMWGNILIGGGIGALVDHNTGAAYEYPSFFQVVMGRSVKIEPAEGTAPQSAASSNPGSGPPGGTNPPVGTFRPVVTSSEPAKAGSVEDQLRELRRLRDAGLLTEDVYADQQRRILERQ
jgi:hypothetical protein